MDEFGLAALREREALRIARRQWFWLDLIVWAAISVFLFVIWLLAGGGWPWFVIPVGAWAIVVAAHAAFAFVLRSPEDILLEREQRERELSGHEAEAARAAARKPNEPGDRLGYRRPADPPGEDDG